MSDISLKSPDASKPISVLYVDDEPDLLLIGKKFLEQKEGFFVDTITSVDEALVQLHSQHFDAIISDYQMPGKDGLSFLKALRSSGEIIPFILFSGRGREEIVIQALNEGADFYLQKGGELEAQFAELAHKVTTAVEQRRADNAFRESENKYRTVFETTGTATVILEKDGSISLANEEFVHLSGFSKEEIENRKSWMTFVEREDLDRMMAWHMLRRSDENTALKHYEFRFITRTAEVRNIFLTVNMIPGTTKSIASLLDITDRKRAEEQLVRKNEELTLSYEQLAATEEELRNNLEELTRREQEIRESEERYRVFISTSFTAVAVHQDGLIVLINDQAARIMKAPSPEVMIGRPLLDYLHPDFLSRVRERMQQINQSSGTAALLEEKFICLDGSTVDVEVMATATLHNGRPAVMVVFRDISDRKRVEANLQAAYENLSSTQEKLRSQYEELVRSQEKLRMSEEKYRRITENAQDMIYRMSLPDGTYEYVSPASTTITGYTPEEHYADSSIPFRLIHPAWIEYFRQQLTALLKGEVSPVYEYQIIDRSGTMRWLNQRNVLLKNETGEPVAIEGIVTDITKQKEIEQELRRSEERFLAVSRNAGSIIWEVDVDGLYRYTSPAIEHILGYPPDEVVGRMHIYDLFDISVREELKKAVFEVSAQKNPFKDFINLNRHKNGSQVILRTSGTPVFDENGMITGYCGIDEDITEQKRFEEALSQANRQLKLLSSITRHDILNKVSVILGFIHLSKTTVTDQALNEFLERIESATKVIKEQIEFTKIYEQLGTQKPQWLELDTNLERQYFPAEIILNDDVKGIMVFADPMLSRVFFNLLDNSIRHGEQVTEIRVSFRISGKNLVILWEDNGTGIPDENKENIFERGFGKNTGFGMFLVREILSITDITITETGEPGKGARFEIVVPEGKWRIDERSSND